MREVVIISGKGGTGKTSLTGAFARLAGNKVLCDLDVDAPDLHILLAPQVERQEEFISGNEAVIDPELCLNCGVCEGLCKFGAIVPGEAAHAIDPLRCEGCGKRRRVVLFDSGPASRYLGTEIAEPDGPWRAP